LMSLMFFVATAFDALSLYERILGRIAVERTLMIAITIIISMRVNQEGLRIQAPWI